MKASLVIMAAGLGSRYGGEKQVDGIGPNGEALMEYSIFDAVQAGFSKIVFIIKPHMLETVKTLCGERLTRMKTPDGTPVEVHYVFQDFSSIPDFYTIPAGRTKPFGTIHAALCAKDVVKEPFALINADDFYGYEAYLTIMAQLEKMPDWGEACMVGYRLKNTVSKHGTVTRGVCLQEGNHLVGLKETFQIKLYEDGRICDTEDPANEIELNGETLVSMNFWGFMPSIFQEMEQYFHDFLRALPAGEEKAECLLPLMVDHCMKQGKLQVSVLSSSAQWFGVTYQEDRPIVAAELKELHKYLTYPPTLHY